ncbi:MAG TPA: 16S rRNA (cytosine(1402)-N(4))-methyltransferase RsmH [Actinomycetota bacterium]|nr:16S rRNA (cytosine(1402)-N(4))-methyltransferase RsmH [Actinomycetota bacterium]
MEQPFEHIPVLLGEVVAALAPALEPPLEPPLERNGLEGAEPGPGGVPGPPGPRPLLVDCTLGGGGHAAALLGAAPHAALLGLDRDPDALTAAGRRLATFPGRVTLMQRRFGDLAGALSELAGGARDVRAVLYDLGVSSPHFDRPDRGFGYRAEGPLDMRMDPGQDLSAADVVNGYPEAELVRILFAFGEERFARRIAAAIVARRDRQPFSTTTDLADTVRGAIPAAARRQGPHPARRTFQALRIEVNGELAELEASLPQAIAALAPGGRVAVISYHSLEDRIVKRAFADGAAGCRCPRDLPVCVCGARATLRLVTRKAITPGAGELASNPRAASAHLRIAERLAPAEAA